MTKNTLADLKVDVPADLLPLIPGYLKRREEEITQLIQQLEAGDFDSMYLIAHKLTGNGAGYGMPALTELGRELGLAAKLKNAPQVRECITQLREIVQILKNRFLTNAA